jgi:RNA polymerase primary sigma factor
MSEFVYNRAFEGKHAERRIMHDPAPIARCSTNWYFAVQETGTKPAATPLLTPEQEKVLFLQYNYCRWRAAKGRRAKRAHWAAVAELKKNTIAEYNLALVLAMVARTIGQGHPQYLDIVSECNVRLVRTIELFDVKTGNKFSTYASRAIVNQSGRMAKKLYQREMGELPGSWSPVTDPVAERRAQVHDDARAQMIGEVRLAMKTAGLTPRESYILEHRYLSETPMILDDIGVALKKAGLAENKAGEALSKERIRQIEADAFTKVRKALDEIKAEGYNLTEGDFVHDRNRQEAPDETLHEVRQASPDQSVRC